MYLPTQLLQMFQNMVLIKRCCCCSLETGTKIIGFIQVIVGLFLVVIALFYILTAVYVKDELLAALKSKAAEANMTEEEIEIDSGTQKLAYAYLIFILILLLAYVSFSALTGALLLAGVYKKKLNYVKWWIRIKTGLVLFAVGFLLLQLLLLLFGMDADLTKSIISLVYDGCLIVVVNSYYDEETEKSFGAEFTDEYSMPPPAYC